MASHEDAATQQMAVPAERGGRPVRVMHLIQGLAVGGLEMMVVNLLRALDKQRFAPAICCFDNLGPLAEGLDEAGIGVHLLRRRPGLDWRYPLRLARLLRRQRVDVLHLHNPTALFYGALAGRIARVPLVVYTEHGRDFSVGAKARLANRLASRLVDRIVVLTDRARRYLTAHEGMPAGRMVKVYNGIDPQRFGGTHARDETRGALGLREGQPVLGMVARLDPIKNHASLLRALARVRERIPEVVLLVVGDGPLGHTLHAQAQGLGLDETAVRFLGSRSDVPDLLRAMDLAVLPSFSEGLSLTLIEAAAAGLPIVATDVGGNGEVVCHGENGLLVGSDDHQGLAEAILAVLEDPARARRMGEAGRARFEAHFTLHGMVAAYQALYAECRVGAEPERRGAMGA